MEVWTIFTPDKEAFSTCCHLILKWIVQFLWTIKYCIQLPFVLHSKNNPPFNAIYAWMICSYSPFLGYMKVKSGGLNLRFLISCFCTKIITITWYCHHWLRWYYIWMDSVTG